MRLNIDRDLVKQLVSGQLPNKSRHLDELTHEPSIWQCDTGQWLSCFDSCHLTILWMASVKDVDLPRHAWDTPPFLLIVSPTLPVQSVETYVRTYVRSLSHVTTKRKEVDHILWVWDSVPRARESPAIKRSTQCFVTYSVYLWHLWPLCFKRISVSVGTDPPSCFRTESCFVFSPWIEGNLNI